MNRKQAPIYKPVVTVCDVLEAGACLDGALAFVKKHKTIAIQPEDFPNNEQIQAVNNKWNRSDYGSNYSSGYGNGSYGSTYDGDGDGYGCGCGNGYGDNYWSSDGIGSGNNDAYSYGCDYSYGNGRGYELNNSNRYGYYE